MSSSLDRDVILHQRRLSACASWCAVPEAVLFLMLEDGQTLAPVVAGVDEFYDEVMALRSASARASSAGWTERAGRDREPRRVRPALQQVPGTPIEPTSLLCVPLIMKDKVAGVLALSRFGEEDFEARGPRAGHHLRRPLLGGDRERAALRRAATHASRSCARRRTSSSRRQAQRPRARWPAAWRTISTTCCRHPGPHAAAAGASGVDAETRRALDASSSRRRSTARRRCAASRSSPASRRTSAVESVRPEQACCSRWSS